MANLSFTFPITKVTKLDDGGRKVEGIASSETVDSQGDILDHDATVKALAGWFKRANIRQAHDPRKPIGKGIELVRDDVARNHKVISRISAGAPEAIQLLDDGVLQAYSVGGPPPKTVVMEKVDGKRVRRVTDYEVSELSLVDAGANPDCAIQLVKADGAAGDVLATEDVPPAVADAANRFAAALLKAIPQPVEKAKKVDDEKDGDGEGEKKPEGEGEKEPPADEEEKPADGEGDEKAKAKKKAARAKAKALGTCTKDHEHDEKCFGKELEAAQKTLEACNKDMEAAQGVHDAAAAQLESHKALQEHKAKAEEAQKAFDAAQADLKAARKGKKAEKALEAEEIQKKKFNAEERKKLAEKGEAMPDGSFPTPTKADWENAVHAQGRAPAGKRPAIKAYLKRRAKKLGITDLPDSLKVLDSILQKHWGGGEEQDIADALNIVFGIKNLLAAEAAEGEDEEQGEELLEVAYRALCAFIALEAGELLEEQGEGEGQTANGGEAAVGGPHMAEAMHEAAVKPIFLKALDAAIQKRFKAPPVKEVEGEAFTVNHGDQLAEAIGAGLLKSIEPLSKALGDLKVDIDEIKAAREKVDIEKALEASPLLKTMGETIEKISKQPAVIMPLRNRQGLEPSGPGTAEPNKNAEVLLKWKQGAPASAAAYLENCIQSERAQEK